MRALPASHTASQRTWYPKPQLTKTSTSTRAPPSVSKSTNCGSSRPCGAPAEGRGRRTVTEVSSWPSSQRAASISCDTELSISIALVKPGGEETLRCTQCSISGRPSRPSSSSALSLRYPAS